MFELFPDQPVYDYPTFINVGYSLVWAFALSSLIAITHRITYSGPEYPKHLFQSLALGSIVAAMVMMAIGDSLARGLGAFGALAMIRFRTRVQDPRNILFIFASLSSGLAVGVYGFTIAFAGTILFCGMALVLHYTNFTTRGQIKAELNIRMQNADARSSIQQSLEVYTQQYHEKGTTIRENRINARFSIVLPYPSDHFQLLESLRALEGVDRVSISYNETMEEI
jgi:uncharacterized membrane protein YhiD involved in acid resistance